MTFRAFHVESLLISVKVGISFGFSTISGDAQTALSVIADDLSKVESFFLHIIRPSPRRSLLRCVGGQRTAPLGSGTPAAPVSV